MFIITTFKGLLNLRNIGRALSKTLIEYKCSRGFTYMDTKLGWSALGGIFDMFNAAVDLDEVKQIEGMRTQGKSPEIRRFLGGVIFYLKVCDFSNAVSLMAAKKRRQGISRCPCRPLQKAYFSKSTNASLSVQASSMMSQPGFSWKLSSVFQGFTRAFGSSMVISSTIFSPSTLWKRSITCN